MAALRANATETDASAASTSRAPAAATPEEDDDADAIPLADIEAYLDGVAAEALAQTERPPAAVPAAAGPVVRPGGYMELLLEGLEGYDVQSPLLEPGAVPPAVTPEVAHAVLGTYSGPVFDVSALVGQQMQLRAAAAAQQQLLQQQLQQQQQQQFITQFMGLASPQQPPNP